jgi:hypothetical protein
MPAVSAITISNIDDLATFLEVGHVCDCFGGELEPNTDNFLGGQFSKPLRLIHVRWQLVRDGASGG